MTVALSKTEEDLAIGIWDEWGDLCPLDAQPADLPEADVAAIIVNRNRPDLTDALAEQVKAMGQSLDVDLYVVEMGSDPDKRSQFCSLHYEDHDFRGKCYGHNVGLRLARSQSRYRFFWILMNDLVFEEGRDALGDLVRMMEAYPRLGVLSPTETKPAHPLGRPRENSDIHLVSSSDYLSLLIRGDCIDRIGFLNPVFKYCWGAGQEYGYKLYRAGWHWAYCDQVIMTHLGGTTYGATKNTPSRDEYRMRAMEFAARYFVETYGPDWTECFLDAMPVEVRNISALPSGRLRWEQTLNERERARYQPVTAHEGCFDKLRACIADKRRKRGLAKEKHWIFDRIEALHPWYYPLEIDGLTVEPGQGSEEPPEKLRNRVDYFSPMLVDRVAERYDFAGKRLLDVGANCGYYSARYIERGARKMTAIEGRWQFVQQGRLYWGLNDFAPDGCFDFIHGDVTASDTWRRAEALGPFDFVLCAGILYHLPNPLDVLRRVARASGEALAVDTRVSDDAALMREPGGWSFDAIVQTRDKRNPRTKDLIAVLEEKGFVVENISRSDPVPEGMGGGDDFSKGRRVVLFARRTTRGA